MRYTGLVFFVLVFLSLPGAAWSQGTPPGGARPMGTAPQAAGQIRGVVAGTADNQPIRSASVEVRSAAGALVTGALTGADGSFRIEGIRPGQYQLRVTALGFATETRSVNVTPAAQQVDAGRIQLAASALQLEGLTVTTERREATLAPDRNTYSVRDMPAATGGNVSDVLRNVPSLEVDIDGRVSLRGNQNVVVQINGRPSPMRGEQLGNFLAQLPANMVDRVEVIPNPSARYDPEGMAGIVNIVLKQNTDLGLSGGLTVGGGTTGQVNTSGNLGYQRGPLTLYGNYGFMRDERQSTGFTNRTNLFLQPLTYLEQENRGTFSPLSHTFNGSAELRLSGRDLLSSNLVLSTRDLARNNDNFYRELNAARALTGRYSRITEASSDNFSFDYALSYKHTVKPRENEFSTELRFNRSSSDDLTRFTQQPLLSDGTPADIVPGLETNETDERNRTLTLQADYTRRLAERVRLETGYKGTLRQLDNDFSASAFSYQQDRYLTDLARSNQFTYDEQVHAAYGVLGSTLGRFDLQAGLRLEQASTEFELATTNESFDNDYRSVFPSGLAAFNLDDSRQLKLSYSKRIERPNTWLLNPFGRFEDPLNVFRGNPYLKPEYTHAFELGFQQSGSMGTMQVTPFYRHTTGAVRRLTTVDDAGVATTTFQNVATSDSYGTDLNGSLRLGRVTGFGGVSAFRQVTDATNIGTDLTSSAFGWSARANATVRVTPRLDAQGFLMYRAPMNTEQGRMSSMSMMNLALRQRLMGDRASVSLRVVDPFNTMRFAFQTSDPRFYQESERRMGARGAYLSFSWNFGQQPRIRPRPQETETRPDDMQQQIP